MTTSSIIQSNLASQLPIKLNVSANFPNWKKQMIMLLDSRGLTDHLTGVTSPPLVKISTNNVNQENPTYVK